MPSVESLRLTHLFSSARKKRFCCKLGKKRRFVLIFEWETLFPVIGRLPVNTHTLDILSEFWTAKVGIILRFSKKTFRIRKFKDWKSSQCVRNCVISNHDDSSSMKLFSCTP